METVKIDNQRSLIRSPRLCKLLKQAAKTTICLLLCVALVWGYSYKEPTQVYATGVEEVVGAAAVAAAAAALGICVNNLVNNEQFKSGCQQIWDKIDTGIKSKVTRTAVASGTVYILTSEFLSSVGTMLKTGYDAAMAQSALDSIPASKLKSDNYSGYLSTLVSDVLGMKYNLVMSGNSYSSAYNNVMSYSVLGTLAIPVTGGTTSYACANSIFTIKAYDDWYGGYRYSRDGVHTFTVNFVPMNTAVFGYIVAMRFANNPGTIQYLLISTAKASTIGASSASNVLEMQSEETAEPIPAAPGHDVYNIPAEDVYADGYSALNHTVSDVVEKVGNAVGTKDSDGTIHIPVDIPSEKVTTDSQAKTQSQTLGKDIADTASKEANDTTNKGKNTAPPKLPGLPDLSLPSLVTKKFPFSLPWDLYLAFSNLVAAPTPPKWEIPFKVQKLNYSQKITIDFSQFEALAKISRWGFSVVFVIALILITRKMIGQGG